MSQEIRRELIRKNLGIRPISHGQIHTCQIALPASESLEIALERRQAIEASLIEHQSNLIPLIVRRATAQADEDIEYEVVYGGDWFQLAKELGVEMLWAWVFDMTDEQVGLAQEEMTQLVSSPAIASPSTSSSGSSESSSAASSIQSDIDNVVEKIVEKKLQLAVSSIRQALTVSLNEFKDTFEDKLKTINYRFDDLNQNLSEMPAVLERLSTLSQTLSAGSPQTKALREFEGPKVNLALAPESEIAEALRKIGTQDKQVDSALAAVKYWQEPGRELTWENLKKSSVKAKPGTKHKVEGFSRGSYDRLHTIGEISNPSVEE